MSHPGNNSLRTPIAKVRGLGSARSGAKSWWLMRVTSLFLIPLVLWFVMSMVGLATGCIGSVGEWLSSPVVAMAMVGFLVATFLHSWLGFKEVIEDYVHCDAMKIAMLLTVKLALFILALACIFAVCKLHFVGMPLTETQPPME